LSAAGRGRPAGGHRGGGLGRDLLRGDRAEGGCGRGRGAQGLQGRARRWEDHRNSAAYSLPAQRTRPRRTAATASTATPITTSAAMTAISAIGGEGVDEVSDPDPASRGGDADGLGGA